MVRKATVDDAERLGEIHVAGWRNAYRGIVSEDILFRRMKVSKSTARFRAALEAGTEETWVEEEQGILRGFMTIGDCRDGDRGPAAFELWGIYVDPAFIGAGIGSRMVALCETEARSRGREEITLWVFERNSRARSFYGRLGFLPEGRSQPLEGLDAVEMRYVKTLGPAAAVEGGR